MADRQGNGQKHAVLRHDGDSCLCCCWCWPAATSNEQARGTLEDRHFQSKPCGTFSLSQYIPHAPCRFTPRRVPLLRDETESMTNPTRRIRAHGRLFSSHGNRTRDQLRDPRAVEKVTLVNRKLIPPRCLTAWCFRRSMDKRGHCSVLIIGWSAQPASVVSTVLSHRPRRSRPMSTSSVV